MIGGEQARWRLASAAPSAPTSLRDILSQEAAAGSQVLPSEASRSSNFQLPACCGLLLVVLFASTSHVEPLMYNRLMEMKDAHSNWHAI